MAKTKQQQQLLVIYLTICLVVVSLLMKVDSVRASSLPLDGNGNMLQQQQQQSQQQEQQQIDNNVQQHNYVMDQGKQRPTTIIPNNGNILQGDDDDTLKGNSLSDDLTRNQMILGHSYDPLNVVKRAPGGFVGMRGKKFYYDDDDSNNVNENDNRLPWNQLQNSEEEDISWDEYAKPNVRRYKKAPTAFYGVRGKKFAAMNGGNPSNDNHRWQEFLQKLEEERVRDAILQNFVETLTGTQNDLPNEMSKRAPTGFTGVRGKRPVIDDLDTSMETLTKRGLGNNAFVGVRGKKDVSHQTFKRSPSGAESLPGGSGKRQRFVDFNNKFVAVRGKKSSYDGMSAFNAIDNNRSPSSSSSAMSLFYGKRAPNGFLGVRGKRPFSADDILTVN